MRRSERVARAALVCLAVALPAACNAIAGLGRFQEVGSDSDSGGPLPESGPAPDEDTGALEDAAVADVLTDAPNDAPNDGTLDGPTSPFDGGPVEGGLPADRRWARWLMPNNTTDADGSLPNPSHYSVTEGFVFDVVTQLLWTEEATSAPTLLAAQAACSKTPLRLPTRIELVSILDTSRSPSTVNSAFAIAPTQKLWSASVTPDGRSWTIDFGSGTVAPSTGNAVLCVAGGP